MADFCFKCGAELDFIKIDSWEYLYVCKRCGELYLEIVDDPMGGVTGSISSITQEQFDRIIKKEGVSYG
jgi:DNA-directed RNA polymerase subunit RPC12/RpoP